MDIERIMKIIELKKDDIIKLVQKLINFKSMNPPGDTREIAEFIKEYVTTRGLKCELYETENGKVNAVVTLTGAGKKKFIWNGHLDVVPISKPEAWTVDPWDGTVHESKIMGRGSADMKGSIGAAISAACIISQEKLPLSGDWILTFSADEETGGRMGVEYLVDEGIITGDACIVGDGNSHLGVGEKGVLWLKVKAEGRPVHAGVSFMGDNAIEKLYKFLIELHKLEEIEREHKEDLACILKIVESGLVKSMGEKFLKEIFHRLTDKLVMNVGMITGGSKINIVPASAEAIVDIRILPGMTNKEVMEEIRQLLKESGIEGISFEIVLKADSSYQNIENQFIPFMKDEVIAEFQNKPSLSISSGFTDARFFRAKGIPTVVYGCDGKNIHGVDEYIMIDDLISTTKAYAMATIKFLK